MNSVTTRLVVNGVEHEVVAPPRATLADILREDLNLTGTHLGCEHGVCGACTVFVDDRPTRACITLVASIAERHVVTIEGLQGPVIDALREGFAAEHGLQCGFCTPGMLISAHDIVTRIPDASPDRLREELAGNICRCTGYVGIVRAVEHAAHALASQEEGS